MTFHAPSLMACGSALVISPDGSHHVPPELWGQYAAIMLLDPKPPLLAQWVRDLETGLGVKEAHRRVFARRTENRSLRPWTILRVSPNMERKVAAALGPKTEENKHGAGLSVYVPLEKYRPRRTWRSRTRPLIPGYVFADLRDDDDLDLARKNYAVREVMCREGRPVRVPATAIGAMILMEWAGAFDATWDAPPPLLNKARGRRPPARKWEKGERVKVAEGPFAGHMAEIVSAQRADRIEVLVTAFGRPTSTTLDEEMLEAIT